jgi:large subunit ribosomal protein L31
MKQGIHPDYVEATVHCSCGNTFVTHATRSELHIELCNQCHPFYTGQQKFVDTGGRVQRFSDKFGTAAQSVMEREAAERETRRVAHEEAALAAREARAIKDSEKAQRDAKAEVAAAREAARADDTVVAEEAAVIEDEAADAEVVADEPADATVAEESAE